MMKDKGYDDQSCCYMKDRSRELCAGVTVSAVNDAAILAEKLQMDAKTNIGGTMFSE